MTEASPTSSGPNPASPEPAALPPPTTVCSSTEPATTSYQPTAILPGPPQLGMRRSQLQIWQGQFPPPEAVERYEAVLPGAFARIMEMAEAAQAAQIRQAALTNQYIQWDVRRSHFLGAGVSVLAMGFAIWAIYLHAEWVSALFLSLPVMAVAKALIGSNSTNTSKPDQQASPPTDQT